VEALVHSGVVVGGEANGLGAGADVPAEVARGRRWCPRAYRNRQHRGRDTSAGSSPGHVLEHSYRLNFSSVRLMRLTSWFWERAGMSMGSVDGGHHSGRESDRKDQDHSA